MSSGTGPSSSNPGITIGLNRARQSRQSKRQSALAEQIKADETISDVTRQELLSGLSGVSGEGLSTTERTKGLVSLSGGKVGEAEKKFADISKTFEKAKEGVDPKFRSRQAFKQKKKIKQDRPGQQQLRGTILGGGPSTLTGKS